MPVVIHAQGWEVHQRLSELGLEEEPLRDVVRRGYLAFITCTANHPRSIPGIWAWAETVRALREYVVQLGWRRSEDNNYSLVLSPKGRVAIAVATGDEGTGRASACPSTKTPKGPSTVGAVESNQMQFGFMEDDQANSVEETGSDPSDERVTWILLIHRSGGEVRCELSVPSSMGYDGRIDGWRERILLTSVPLDHDVIDVVPPTQPDISVDVKRRA